MKVSEVLSTNIIKISKDASVLDAAKLLFKNQVSGLLVVNEHDELVGLISEKDIYRALYPDYKDFYLHPEAYLDFEQMESKAEHVKHWPVERLMRRELYTITDTDPLMKVGALMLSKNVNRLPLFNKNGKLVGIVSRREIYQHIFQKEFI